MKTHVLEREQHLQAAPDEVFEFFSDAFRLEPITPPWLRFRVLTPAPVHMREGTLLEYRLRIRGMPVRWRTRIERWDPPHAFVDVQLEGPYRLWHHTHTFTPHGRGTLMRDVVRYALPLGPIGALARTALVRRDLERIFDFRRAAIERAFA